MEPSKEGGCVCKSSLEGGTEELKSITHHLAAKRLELGYLNFDELVSSTNWEED